MDFSPPHIHHGAGRRFVGSAALVGVRVCFFWQLCIQQTCQQSSKQVSRIVTAGEGFDGWSHRRVFVGVKVPRERRWGRHEGGTRALSYTVPSGGTRTDAGR
ncbi:hypothetical protein VTH06DRAFT_5858 [Thermothelomyces fergusii]